MNCFEQITGEHVAELLASSAMAAALVRYGNGTLQVRSSIPTRAEELDDYDVITLREDVADIDQSGMDFDDLAESDLDALAEYLNVNEEDMAMHG